VLLKELSLAGILIKKLALPILVFFFNIKKMFKVTPADGTGTNQVLTSSAILTNTNLL